MRNNGFTLAEVLITLAIIGVIAAISVPTLIQRTQMEELKVSYKKAFAEANQALALMDYEAQFISTYNWTDASYATNFERFGNYFKKIKYCDGTVVTTDNCWDMTGEKSWQDLGGYPINTAPAFIDNAGRSWAKLRNVNLTPELLLDTNGFKKPNEYGRDRFVLYFGKVQNNASIVSEPQIYVTDDWTNASASYTSEDYRRCPSIAKHPCYNTSWIAGGK